MRTVFETQVEYTPNWIMMIFSISYILIGITVFKKRLEEYKYFTQMISPVLFMCIGGIGLIIFIVLFIHQMPTPMLFSAVPFLLFLPLIGFLDFKKPEQFSDVLKPLWLFILGVVFCTLTTFGAWSLMCSLVEEAQIQRLIYDTYHEGEALVVEGEVQDFHPMPETLHDSESFTVSGIEFSYNNHKESSYYSQCAFDGGAITRNNQKVKIWYVKTDDGEKYIARIDLF